jgi:hypothetical protein
MLSHSWLYRSLIYDVLTVKNSKVDLTVQVDKDSPAQGTKKLSYDLNPCERIFMETASSPFPNAAEHVTSEWSKYQADADAVLKSTGASSLDDLSGNTSQLKNALELLPELRERKSTSWKESRTGSSMSISNSKKA